MKKLFIIGAGGFGREVLWLVERINEAVPVWEVEGFLDDNKEFHGTLQDGYPVLGGCDYLKNINRVRDNRRLLSVGRHSVNVINRLYSGGAA